MPTLSGNGGFLPLLFYSSLLLLPWRQRDNREHKGIGSYLQALQDENLRLRDENRR